MTEINKLISVYGSISYFGKKLDEKAELFLAAILWSLM